ncbi:PP2C family serine/threonine-protein phosphatase [Streptomyces sp. BE20]|uniref:PP2C family serine/threonine-protein phosphatase n=1 Tax=Streptomyces sp. BE20 TaxID=3002525 RepID=UPI002E771051|nr:PP2C family serine/threonine-protein phosphatase [Streptomyces sp. BE20]MEE1828934.1 PP2C family serine/threonine-protein phosphatase [Streptomyces sp. BE20]
MNPYDNPQGSPYDNPHGNPQGGQGPEPVSERAFDPIDVASSVYEHGWGPGPVAPAPARPVPSTPVPFLPHPATTGPDAAGQPGRDRPAAPPGVPPAPAAGASGPVPVLGEEPGAVHHVGRKPPAYTPEPTGIADVGADLYAGTLPDTVVDGGTFGPVTVRAASVRGDSHRYRGECRQDAVLVTRAGDLLLLAVADGVGSQQHSQRGSNGVLRLLARQVAHKAETLLACLRIGAEADFAVLMGQMVAAVAGELAKDAGQWGLDPKSYATTLRALLVPADADVAARGFVSVGDGGLLRLREGGWTNCEQDEDDGALISTRTHCLPEAYEQTRVRLITDTRPGDLLVLCTDGLALPLLKEPDLQDFLADRWGGPDVPGLAEFLWQAQVRVRSYDDDRTAVCLWEAAR